jgi:hypothetical protein
MPRATRAIVYWLYDETCIDPKQHGYVGMTVDWPHRMHRHRCESDFLPKQFQGRVLFEGTINQCLDYETEMRPTAGIGWNRLPGGLGGHASKGIPKSAEHRAKIAVASLKRYEKKTEHEKTSRAVKRGLKHIDRSGTNNSHFGKSCSEETKQKMRDAIKRRGGVNGENNPNYRHGRYT